MSKVLQNSKGQANGLNVRAPCHCPAWSSKDDERGGGGGGDKKPTKEKRSTGERMKMEKKLSNLSNKRNCLKQANEIQALIQMG